MGKRSRVSETSSLIIYYILIINTCCDISLINCDIHEMRQQHVNRLANSVEINANEIDFKIDPIELQAHIMTGLNMTKTPDAELVSAKNPKKINIYEREIFFMFLLGHRDTRQGGCKWVCSLRISKTCLRREQKKILVVLNWQLTNRPAYFVAIEMTFCVGRDVIEGFALRNKIEEGFQVQGHQTEGFASAIFESHANVGRMDGRDWIFFDENLISARNLLTSLRNCRRYAKKSVRICPRIMGFGRLSISSQSTKVLESSSIIPSKSEWIN